MKWDRIVIDRNLANKSLFIIDTMQVIAFVMSTERMKMNACMNEQNVISSKIVCENDSFYW